LRFFEFGKPAICGPNFLSSIPKSISEVKSQNSPRLLRITTVPISLKLLLGGQLTFFKRQGFEVLSISADGPEVQDGMIEGAPHKVVPMTRKITPIQDLACLFKIIRIIRQFRPDIVHTHTPKAGLLGMLAAWFCSVPVRMHTVAGLPLMEKSGFTKRLLVFVERITYRCATVVYPNSAGLMKFIQQSIGEDFPLQMIGKGSSNGIDIDFFSRTEILEKEARAIRKKYGIGVEDLVYSFVGRVVRDKGIGELVKAFRQSRQGNAPETKQFLLVIGHFEQDLDPISPEDLAFLRSDGNVVLAGYQSDVRPWLIASDIFVFPSYREGFPNVVMQAGCLGVPAIVSNINGCNEIVEHNLTGLIVTPKDAEALRQAMRKLADDKLLRSTLAQKAYSKITTFYDQRYVWQQLLKEYKTNLNAVADMPNNLFYRNLLKPLLDKVVAIAILLITSPVLLICMILLAMANGGKVWFLQPRPGKHGRLFKVIKFRTMSDERDSSGELLPDEKRLHGIGKFIRKASLDELPQLLNVARGEMSIVGPRPLLAEYLPLYSEEQCRRHNVKPGITGWAQVNGRNAISWEQKFGYDVWYVKNQSFWLDLRILFLTVLKVFKAEGISSATSATMEKFRGSKPEAAN
jgi:lipopolysaccharide/colanic/teichoic acid biosynthesis glycosyltransferase